MATEINTGQASVKVDCKSSKIEISYRGFASIDQEIERKIAMQWFSSKKNEKKSSYSQRNYLLKKSV